MAKNDQVDATAKRVAEETEAAEARMNSSQPTPTQAENDRAKLGVESLKQLDDKEGDGTPEQRDLSADGGAAYTTRSAKNK